MAVTTWEEALEGMTPQEVWALRKIRMHLRRFLMAEGVEYSTRKSRYPGGYGGLERVMMPVGNGSHVLLSGDVPDALNGLFLALDETIYSYGEDMLNEEPGKD